MAATMTKTALVRQLAEKLELTNKQVGGVSGSTGRHRDQGNKEEWRVCHSRARPAGEGGAQGAHGPQPETGEQIKIKAKTVVKFRVAKSAKDSIAPPKK